MNATTLAERCSYLEEENRQLRDALRGSSDARFPFKWGLNAGEKRLLTSLISSPDGFRTNQALLYACRRAESVIGGGLVKVRMVGLRKKLRPLGVEIHTVWAQGYRIDPESKARIIGARTREVAA